MKKIGLLLLVAFVLGAGSAYFFSRTKSPAMDTAYADYLPPSTLAVVSLRDINGLTDIFPKTALGHFFSKETMGAILTDMHANQADIDAYARGYDQVFSVLHNPGFRMVFGDDVELAWLPVNFVNFSADPEKAIEKSLVVLATTASNKALETFAKTLLHKDVDTVKTGDLELTRLRLDTNHLDNNKYLYAYSQGDRLLLAFSPQVIRRCVQANRAGKTLQQAENFINAGRFGKDSSLRKIYSREFVQLDQLRSFLVGLKDKDVQQVVGYLQGMQYLASVAGKSATGWKADSTTRYTYDKLDPKVRELVDAGGKKNISLHLLQDNPLLYSWSASLGASTVVQSLSAADPGEYKKVDRRLHRELGLSLAQIAGAFGPQYGLVLNKIVQAGMFPLPKMIGFVQVRDHKVVETLLERLRRKADARGMAGAAKEQVGPYTLYSWALLPGEATQPAFVLTRDMLYLANGPSGLKKLLTVENERQRLPKQIADKLGPALAAQVQQADNGVFLFWPNRFAAQVKGAADWLAGLVAASKGKSVTRLKDELLRLLQSTEKAVLVSDLFPDHGRAVMTFQVHKEKEVKP